MALESVYLYNIYLYNVYDIGLRQPSDRHVAGRVYDHFDWPVIRQGHQVWVTGHFHYRFSGINYVSADVCLFKDMI